MLNKEVVRFEGVVNSDSSVEQLLEDSRSQASIKGTLFKRTLFEERIVGKGIEQLFEGSRSQALLKRRLFERTPFKGRIVEDCWERNPTSANQGVGRVFISKEYISIGMSPFGETKTKATRTYLLKVDNTISLRRHK